jgi:O-antigen/teichoic acid export membrane protein
MLDWLITPFHRLDAPTRRLLGGASIAFSLKLLGAALSFLSTLVLARLLGADGLGSLQLALTLVIVAAALGAVGMDHTMVRWVAGNVAGGRWPRVRGGIERALALSALASGSFAVVLAVTAPWFANRVFEDARLTVLLYWLAPALVLLAMATVQAAALQGLGRIAAAVVTLNVLPQLAIVLLVPLSARPLGVNAGALAFLVGTLLALAYGRWRWQLRLAAHPPGLEPVAAITLLRSGLHFLSITALNLWVAWAAIIALGIWHQPTEVGLYSTAYRTALLTSFVLTAVNAISAPTFAELHERKDLAGLGRLARWTARLMTLAVSPLLLIFLLWPAPILSLFGAEFRAAAPALAVLASGQFVNVATGSVGYLLAMTGRERLLRNAVAAAAAVNLVLILLLVPRFGLIGAAIASAAALAAQNLLAAVLVWRAMGIITLPFWPRPRAIH